MVPFKFLVVVICMTFCKAQEIIDASGCRRGLCWNAPDYPHKEIYDKIESYSGTFGRFNKNINNVEKLEDTTCHLCNVKKYDKVHPLILKEKGKRYFVVNTEKYQQSVVISICGSDEDTKCNEISRDNNSTGTITSTGVIKCEQMYTSIKLLCYDPNTQEFIGKSWSYESSCACVVKE